MPLTRFFHFKSEISLPLRFMFLQENPKDNYFASSLVFGSPYLLKLNSNQTLAFDFQVFSPTKSFLVKTQFYYDQAHMKVLDSSNYFSEVTNNYHQNEASI